MLTTKATCRFHEFILCISYSRHSTHTLIASVLSASVLIASMLVLSASVLIASMLVLSASVLIASMLVLSASVLIASRHSMLVLSASVLALHARDLCWCADCQHAHALC